MIQGLPELPNATKSYDKWYTIDGEPAQPPVHVFQIQTNVPIQHLLESGDDSDQVIDQYLESMREDAVQLWAAHRARFRETENPILQQLRDSIGNAAAAPAQEQN